MREQDFIGREIWLQRFQDYLKQDQGIIWRITGQPGIGKSTLLRRFEHACDAIERPNVWLDMEGFLPAHGLDVLATLAGSARYFDTEKTNKTLKEKVGEGFKTATSGLVGVLELAKDFIPGGELAASAAKMVVDLAEGVAGNAAQISEHEAAAHPELYLLNALAAAGANGKKPVCLVDTYEHVLRADLKITSRLMFGYGQLREGQEKVMPLSAWLAEVFDYLESKGWRIVMVGRSIPRSKTDDNLPRFSRAEILEAAHNRPALRDYLPTQESAIANVLTTLSFDGNPLWLQVAMNLLENLLAEGKDLEQLAQQPDYLHDCFEEEDPFDLGAYDGIEHGRCKLALFNTLTRHIDGLEDQAWKIALPRVLDKGIVLQLFEPQQANAILHNFKIAGVFRVSGQQFTLHEEIRDLLLAYARSKGWLDTDATRALHGKLWDYLNSFYLGKLPLELRAKVSRGGLNAANFETIAAQLSEYFPLNWMLEACYHRVMSLAELPGNTVTPVQFWQGVGGSVLPPLAKWWVMENLPDNSAFQVSALTKIFSDELVNLRKTYGEETAQALRQTQLAGHTDVVNDIAFWECRIQKYALPGDYIGCAKALLNKGGKLSDNAPEGAIAVFDSMLQRFGDSTVPGVQEVCAMTLHNKGSILSNDDPAGAVAVYDSLLHRFGDSTVPNEQEACARALLMKGAMLQKLNDPAGAVAVFDSLVLRFGDSTVPGVQESCAKAFYNKSVMTLDPASTVAVVDSLLLRFGDSTVPGVQDPCAKALFNKGVTLGEKLNDPAGEIAVYDALLLRYGDSSVPGVQEWCATALFNKGGTLANKLNDPAGAVAVYDALLHRYGDSRVPGVQELCATALIYKGWTLGEKLNDPAGAVAVVDDLLHRYGDSSVPGVQERCATALIYKGVTLGEKLNDPAGEVAVVDDLLHRYGDSSVPGVQEQCATALVNKAIVLNRLGGVVEAVACYDDLLARYSQSENPTIQVQCQMALANTVEPLLVWGRNAEAIPRIHQVLERTDANKQEYAIMPFLLWLAEADTTPQAVLAAIRALSPEVAFTWGWGDIRPLVDKLPEPRKTQAECFIAFFEQHHDIVMLESCLAAVAGFDSAQPSDSP